nr:MAG TPA: hypothetical protein [Microviridae sp.]
MVLWLHPSKRETQIRKYQVYCGLYPWRLFN